MSAYRGEATTTTSGALNRARDAPARISVDDFTVREYVGALARELAQMARQEGDEALGGALDLAAVLAARPGPVEPPGTCP